MDYTYRRFRGSVSLLLLILAVFISGSGSSCATVEEKKQATINFVNQGAIQDWRAEGNKAIVISAVNNKWYRAKLLYPCYDLPFEEGIAFVSSPGGQLNRYSSVIIRNERYPFQSLEEIPDPSRAATQ